MLSLLLPLSGRDSKALYHNHTPHPTTYSISVCCTPQIGCCSRSLKSDRTCTLVAEACRKRHPQLHSTRTQPPHISPELRRHNCRLLLRAGVLTFMMVQSSAGPAASLRCVPPSSRRMKLALLAAVLAGAAVQQCHAVLPTQAAANVMALGTQLPDITRALSTIKSSDADLADYLADPKSVCTFIAPTNSAIFSNAAMLGKFAGKAAQDEAMVSNTLRYHVIPGKALTAEELGRVNRTLTKANQTLYTWDDGGNGTIVYFRRDYPIRLNKSDIQAGNCIVHTINMALVPPKYEPVVAAWLDELRTWPPKAPKSEWPPAREPLPGSLETLKEDAGGARAPSAAPSAEGGKAAAGSPGAAPAAPAKSSAWAVRPSQLLLVVALAGAMAL